MAQISVDIGGFNYKLSCRDGEEERLSRLAAHINAKAQDLTAMLGQVGENRLLLMSALLVADELFEQRESGGSRSAAAAGADTAELSAFLKAAAERVEMLAERLGT